MFCTSCGNTIKEKEIFCTNCGKAKNIESIKNTTPLVIVANNEKWWIRLLKVLYIVLYVPLLIIIPVVWSANVENCYYYTCRGSTGEAFGYSLITVVVYFVIVRLIKLATKYVVIGVKPKWKQEFKRFF